MQQWLDSSTVELLGHLARVETISPELQRGRGAIERLETVGEMDREVHELG